jgi:hypothetical protein
MNPQLPSFQYVPPPGTPIPQVDVADMDHFHKVATSGALTDLLAKIAKAKH